MKKLIYFLIFLMFSIPALTDSGDSYLQDFSWKLIYKCYDDGCLWNWNFCKSIIFNESGLIYNRHQSSPVGVWEKNKNTIKIELFCCHEIQGALFYIDQSYAFEGIGYHFPGNKRKYVKLLLIRESENETR